MHDCIVKWDTPPSILHQKRESMEKTKLYKGRKRLVIKAKKRDMSVSIFDLEKVPAEPLLKMAIEEIGEQESYIEELEERIKQMKKENAEILKAERKALVHEVKSEAFLLAKRNQYYTTLENRLSRQGKLVRSLIESRDELVLKVLKLKEQINLLSQPEMMKGG